MSDIVPIPLFFPLQARNTAILTLSHLNLLGECSTLMSPQLPNISDPILSALNTGTSHSPGRSNVFLSNGRHPVINIRLTHRVSNQPAIALHLINLHIELSTSMDPTYYAVFEVARSWVSPHCISVLLRTWDVPSSSLAAEGKAIQDHLNLSCHHARLPLEQ